MFDAMMTAFQVEFLFGGLFCALFVGLWIVFLFIAIWVYRDAESRGMSGVLWLLVVLVAGIIGLIIYLVVRHDKRPAMAPPTYGQPGYGAQGWAAPPPGGMPPAGPAPAAQAFCRNCGSPLAPGATFCPKCGAKV